MMISGLKIYFQEPFNFEIKIVKCFAYVLLFDFVDSQKLVNELVTGKVRFPPAPLSDFIL